MDLEDAAAAGWALQAQRGMRGRAFGAIKVVRIPVVCTQRSKVQCGSCSAVKRGGQHSRDKE